MDIGDRTMLMLNDKGLIVVKKIKTLETVQC